MNRKIKLGMVGGGPDAFIGDVHRMAARLDDQIELVCGAFSSDENRSREFGLSLGLPPQRCYVNYQQMMAEERALPAQESMDLLAIVTPNHLHYPIASLAIRQGFHVICDKPATLNLQQALNLSEQLKNSPSQYAITYTYTGYPMVREARARVTSGQLGDIRKVIVEYPQGWLANTQEPGKQAKWRLDPAQSGISCCMGDIGSHAFNLAEFVTDLYTTEVCAVLQASQDRLLDDEGTVLLKFNNGAQGVLMASQVAVGEENNLRIRVYGTQGSIEWSHETPQQLEIRAADCSKHIIKSGSGHISPHTSGSLRLPPGHPEGYIEAFANLYTDFAQQLNGRQSANLPGIQAAVRGMAFIENVVAASGSEIKWHPFLLTSPAGEQDE